MFYIKQGYYGGCLDQKLPGISRAPASSPAAAAPSWWPPRPLPPADPGSGRRPAANPCKQMKIRHCKLHNLTYFAMLSEENWVRSGSPHQAASSAQAAQ